MRLDTSKQGAIAIKLDMSKVYACVEWPFLTNVMLRIGFNQWSVELIVRCVRTASLSFLVNGVPRGHILLTEGFGKGTPCPHTFSFFVLRASRAPYGG